MADRKITDLTALAAGSQATGDLLTIVDVSEAAATDKNKKITVESLFKGIPGNVGIGTSSADQALTVQGLISTKQSNGTTRGLIGSPSWDGSKVAIQNGTLAQSFTNAALHQDATGNTVVNSASGGATQFAIGGGEKARIDSSGRLLVGTTSSRGGNFNNGSGVDSQFLLEGTSFVTSFANIVRNSNDANSAGFALSKSRGTSVGSNTIVQNGDKLGEIAFQGSDGAKMVGAADIKCQVDGTPGTSDMPGRLVFSTCSDGASSPTERMRISSNGSTTLTTNSTDTSVTDVTQLVLKNSSNAANTMAGIRFEASSNSDSDYFIVHKKHGSGTGADLIVQRGSNERLRFIESGGIAFNGDTAAANALDDYEEGTWTANLQSSNDNATRTVGNTTGYYVKVGTMCTAYYYTQGVNCTNAGTGTAVIRGLPFTSANLSNGFAVCTITHATVFASRVQNGYVNPNTTHLVFIGEESTSGVALVPAGTRYLMVSMTYRTE
nr:putative endosialidase [uncultured Mediterranean phage uvMED]